MTVKCVDRFEKDVIVDLYKIYNVSVTQLAGDFQVSRRTIYRVLAEQGITFEKPEPAESEPRSLIQRISDTLRTKVFFFVPSLR